MCQVGSGLRLRHGKERLCHHEVTNTEEEVSVPHMSTIVHKTVTSNYIRCSTPVFKVPFFSEGFFPDLEEVKRETLCTYVGTYIQEYKMYEA